MYDITDKQVIIGIESVCVTQTDFFIDKIDLLREDTMEKTQSTSLEIRKPLWTRDFTIITIGSIVSMLGNAMAGFAMSLMVLDYTGSSVLFAIYQMTYMVPQLIAPIVSGAILDRFSRKRMIYTLDFMMAGLYLLLGLLLSQGWFSFPLFALFSLTVGSVKG